MASNPYVNKVQYGNQTVMDISDTTATEKDVLQGRLFYLKSGAQATGTAIGGVPEEELRDTVGWTGKNLLPNNATSQTINGVTFTVNADGSVTANGTATANANFEIKNNYVLNEKVILSGCVGGSANTFKLQIYDHTAGQGYNDFGDGVEVDAIGHNTLIQIVIYSGQTVNNLTFYPMLRDASISDNTYEPYHSSVKQTLRDAEVIEGKNLLPITANTQTINGVTFTVNKDAHGNVESVKVNGTASARASLVLWHDYKYLYDYLPDGKYYMSGCPSGGSYDGYAFTLQAEGSGNISDIINGTPFELSSVSGQKYRWIIDVKSGTVCNNLMFYPMLCTEVEWNKSHDYEPYYIPLKDSKFDRAEQRVLGAKNLLPNNASTQTINGVTFTVNADGSITVNGTASAQTVLSLYHENQNCPYIGNAILSGCPDGGSSSTYDLRITDDTVSSNTDYGNGVNINISPTGSWTIAIMIRNGQVCNNLVFKPMLRLASDPDDTYVPYAMTNRELTDAISSGHTMTPSPSASLTEQNVVTAVNAALVEGGINDDVPSNFDMGKWSNTMTKAFLVQGVAGSSTPIGTSGVGTWPADVTNPTSAEKADWMCIPELYGCGSASGKKIDLVYDPATVSVPIARGGYVIDDNETMSDGQGGTINCAKVCLKFANEIPEADTHTAVVGVEVTIKRTETVFVG